MIAPSIRRFFSPGGLCVAAFVFLFAPDVVMAASPYQIAWSAWLAELKKQCPSHRVDWVEDGGYDDLLGAFEKTLPARTRRQLDVMSKQGPGCGGTQGFTCEMGSALLDYNKLGLIKKFAAYGCRHYRCEDIALCNIR